MEHLVGLKRVNDVVSGCADVVAAVVELAKDSADSYREFNLRQRQKHFVKNFDLFFGYLYLDFCGNH